MREALDPFDPNNWNFEHDFRMYAGANADISCLVDEEDYRYFTKWMWTTKQSPCGKLYFRRAVNVYGLTGERITAETVYLHIEICRVANGEMPSRRRCIVDHKDGNSLNNRRANLYWATKRENNRNRFGRVAYQQNLAL